MAYDEFVMCSTFASEGYRLLGTSLLERKLVAVRIGRVMVLRLDVKRKAICLSVFLVKYFEVLYIFDRRKARLHR